MPCTEQELFHAALDLPEGADAAAWLERVCPQDGALRARVQALLASAQAAHSLLPDAPAAWSAGEQAADVLPGGWRLLRVAGQGGFGTVWEAEQSVPIRRRAAVKILKAGLDSAAVLARFEAERQTLSMMDHPHVARMLDAGCTASGRPFFVMEYIAGRPLLEWARASSADARTRLEVMQQVAAAVHHAHLKGVIHRDLKPSNILIVHDAGPPVAKVIDFGIAKSLEPVRGEDVTLAGHRWGTPEFMSPEQQAGEPADARMDVYALGRVLQQLMAVPGPERSAQEAAWIAARAAAESPAERYGSAAAMQEDLRRALSGEALAAGPPTRWYAVRKFLWRHRAAAAGTAVALMGLVAGLLVALHQRGEALHARDAALREHGRTERMYRVLQEAILSAQGEVGRPHGYTVAQLVMDLAQHPPPAVLEDAATERSFRYAAGVALNGHGHYAEAADQFRRVLALAAGAAGRETALAHQSLGHALFQMQRPAEALPHYQESAAWFQRPGAEPEMDGAMSELGVVQALRTTGQLTDAAARLDRVAQWLETAALPPLAHTAIMGRILRQRMLLQRARQDTPAWEAAARARIAFLQQAGNADESQLQEARHDWHHALAASGRAAEALAHERALLLERTRLLGPDHPLLEDSRALIRSLEPRD